MALKSFAKVASLLGTALLAATSASARTTTYTVFDEPYTMGQMSGSFTSLYDVNDTFSTRPTLGFTQGMFSIYAADEVEGRGVLGFRALSDQSMIVEIENISPGERVGLQLVFEPLEAYRYLSFDYQVTYSGPAENIEASLSYYTADNSSGYLNLLETGSVTNLYLTPGPVQFFRYARFHAVVTNVGSMTFQLSNLRGTAEPIAIPEPASAALLAGLGLFACAATRRRR